nr:putative nucleotidyltransferase, ribonuclease H [Tanacetum cinerariifolium]
PNEIPTGLPPIREVQHCIDLVPGSVLPNKEAYHMNPKEHEELQRQVDELLKKGVLQESKSLCVVPALLVPKKDALGVCVWIVGLLTRSPSNIVAIIKYELDPKMSGRRLSRRRVVFMN